jgi:hypothetical protein
MLKLGSRRPAAEAALKAYLRTLADEVAMGLASAVA